VKNDRLYLLHIVDSLQWIEQFVAEGRDAFLASRKTQDAVIRNFEIIGEAAKRLSPGITRAHNHIPWRRIAGFRDVLIHNYMPSICRKSGMSRCNRRQCCGNKSRESSRLCLRTVPESKPALIPPSSKDNK